MTDSFVRPLLALIEIEIHQMRTRTSPSASPDHLTDEFLRLQKKYAANGPRYTSYPTAIELLSGFGHEDLAHHLLFSNHSRTPRDISLYLHLPFCRHLCFYCGCNKVVTKNPSKGEEYLGYLAKEIQMTGQFIDPARKVRQLHLGGGTPTFYRIDQLKSLLDAIGKQFLLVTEADRDYSIEIDPRTVDTA